MVPLLKDIAEGEKKIPSGDSKKASSSSASGGGSKEEQPAKKGKGAKEAGPAPKRWERTKIAPKPELVRMNRWRQHPIMMKELVISLIGGLGRTCLENPAEEVVTAFTMSWKRRMAMPSHKADFEFTQKVRKDGSAMYYSTVTEEFAKLCVLPADHAEFGVYHDHGTGSQRFPKRHQEDGTSADHWSIQGADQISAKQGWQADQSG